MPKKNLPAKQPQHDPVNEPPVTDINDLMDRILDDVEPGTIPVDYIYHLAVVAPDGELVVLLGHDICDFRYGHERFKGWKVVHYSVNVHKLYHAVAKESMLLWEKVYGKSRNPFDDDTFWDDQYD